MRRRDFLRAASYAGAFAVARRLARAQNPEEVLRMKAPYRVLFSNDTTNIETCGSPYHRRGEPFVPEMLEATVDETADTGIEVHLLQPGVGVVPWWKSSVCPADEHYRWWQETYGAEPDGYGRYMLAGGDMVAVFVNRCRARGLAPFVSLRLNDGHGKEFVNAAPGDKAPSWTGHCLSRFYHDHPEYRLGPNLADWNQRVLNWALPEVRDRQFAFIRELCENYDLDGFELDFMRHVSYFRLDETTPAERAGTMTDFVRRVRELLDRTARPGRHRWLCVRVPAHLAPHEGLGLDLPAFVRAGVEMVNASSYYFTIQQTDLARLRELVPGAALYLEVTHATSIGRVLTAGYDNFTFRRTTDEQFHTAAHLAYWRGGDGVSAFNFVYYREHGTPGRGPFDEPPFHVFSHLGDPDWLARQPQHYIVGNVWDQPHVPGRPLPRKLEPGQTAQFTLDLAPRAGGWTAGGRLRIQTEQPMGESRWTARLNGVELAPTDDISEPYPNPYSALLGTPETLRAWTVPADLPRDGDNRAEMALTEGGPATIILLDLALT